MCNETRASKTPQKDVTPCRSSYILLSFDNQPWSILDKSFSLLLARFALSVLIFSLFLSHLINYIPISYRLLSGSPGGHPPVSG